MARSPASMRRQLRELGAAIRTRRLGRGLTQQQLADRLGVSAMYVSLLERGGRNPPITTVLAIARGLQVPLAGLMPSRS